MGSKKILVLGSGSFAARGLVEQLAACGHDVVTFHRGKTGCAGSRIFGSVMDLCRHPHLRETFDVVINYVVLKGESLEQNGRFIDELLRYCEQCNAGHLIHISSVSVYAASVRHVVEDAEVEQDAGKKGSYGALKVLQDLHLQQRKCRELRVSYVRPGFILGSGLANPVVGMAVRLGGGFVLQLGSGKNVVPITTRKLVSKAVSRLAEDDATDRDQVVMIADMESPSRHAWIVECCKCTDIGSRVVRLPVLIWRCAGLAGELAVRLLRKNIRPMNMVASMCRDMSYDASKSEAMLHLNFSCDWRTELRNALTEEQGAT